jgi:hypothetical protein
MNVNIRNIHNTYNTTIINRNDNRVSYNGGRGGIDVHPTAEQEAADHDRHIGPVAAQTKHMNEARTNPKQRASTNMGKPAIAATDKPGNWKGRGVVPAKEAGAPYKPEDRGGNAGHPENRPEDHAGENNTKPAVHPHDLPAAKHPDAPNTGDANRDRKLQQQQEKMASKQQQERDNLQKKQDQEHQRMDQQRSNDQRRQQVEQRHQQQTSQMQQRHEQQNQHFQQRVQRASPSRGRR